MIPRSEVDPREPIFVYENPVFGQTVIFASGRMAKYALEHIEPVDVPMDADFARYCVTNRGVEPHRLAQIEPPIHTPILYVQWVDGKTHLLVDGHHRYVRAYQCGYRTIPSYILAYAEWEKFLVEPFDRRLTPEEVLRARSGF